MGGTFFSLKRKGLKEVKTTGTRNSLKAGTRDGMKKEKNMNDMKDNNFNKRRISFGCVSSYLRLVAKQPDHWYADSAASSHMTDKRSFFSTWNETPPGVWE